MSKRTNKSIPGFKQVYAGNTLANLSAIQENPALIPAGLLGISAVLLATVGRYAQATSGVTNIPILFFTSFLRGLSKSSPNNTTLDPNVLNKVETRFAKIYPKNTFATLLDIQEGSIQKQIKKDFNDAYKIQEDKFKKGLDAFKEAPYDRAQDFLVLPKKEMLAFDRSARALFFREFGLTLESFDKLGHAYSASISVILVNIYKLGEFCGQSIRAGLEHTQKDLSKAYQLGPAAVVQAYQLGLGGVCQLYFASCLLNTKVLNSTLGKTLGLTDIAKTIRPALESIPTQITQSLKPKAKGVVLTVSKCLGITWAFSSLTHEKSTLFYVYKTANGYISPLYEDAKWVFSPLKNKIGLEKYLPSLMSTLKHSNKKTLHNKTRWITGYAFDYFDKNDYCYIENPLPKTFNLLLPIKFILTTKTYILAPMLAGLFDGLMQPISKDAIENVGNAAQSVARKDQKSLLTIIHEDFNVAYKAAFKKFTKYDKFFTEEIKAAKNTLQQNRTEEQESPGVRILKKKPSKAVNVLSGRAEMKKYWLTEKALNYWDIFTAGTQAGASMTAKYSYKMSYKMGKCTTKYTYIGLSHVKRIMSSQNKNQSHRK